MELHAAWHEAELKKAFPGLFEKLNDANVHTISDVRKVVDNFNSVRLRRGEDRGVSERIIPLLYVEHKWRKNRIVYEFDSELMSVLSDQANSADGSEELPADLILHLPFECMSIQTSTIFLGVQQPSGEFKEVAYNGQFFITITEPGDVDEWPTLYSIWFDDRGMLEEAYIPIIPGKTINQCRNRLIHQLSQKMNTTDEVAIRSTKMYLQSMIAMQVVLYLVSQNAEVEENKERGNIANPKKPRQIKKVATVNEVGYHIGAVLRKARQQHDASQDNSGNGSSKRSHARRGHWHHFWTGPRDGERVLILKWVAPTFIHPETKDDLPTVVQVIYENDKEHDSLAEDT